MKKLRGSAPKRFQEIMLPFQRYDVEVVYLHGKPMFLAYTLSISYISVVRLMNSSTTILFLEVNMYCFFCVVKQEATCYPLQEGTQTTIDIQREHNRTGPSTNCS